MYDVFSCKYLSTCKDGTDLECIFRSEKKPNAVQWKFPHIAIRSDSIKINTVILQFVLSRLSSLYCQDFSLKINVRLIILQVTQKGRNLQGNTIQ